LERAYRHIGYALLLLPAFMVAGFWAPYFSQIPHFEAFITPAVHAHALVQFSWVALLVVQPLLIRFRAFGTHRALGKFTFVLAPIIALLSIAMMTKEYGENMAQGMSSHTALLGEFLSCSQLLLFVLFYLLAVVYARRRQIGAHLRSIICTALVLLPAGLARVLGYGFDVSQRNAQTVSLTVIVASLVGLIAYDRHHGAAPKPHSLALAAYLLIGCAWVVLGRPVG
jgi:hypothetical protein